MRYTCVGRVLGGGLAVAMLVGAGLVSAPGASARPAAARVTATLTPATALGGSNVTVSGRAGTRPGRPAQLQLQTPGGWALAASTSTKRRGYYSVTDPVARTGVYRVVLPRVRRGHRVLRTLVSAPRQFSTASVLANGQTMGSGQYLTSPNGAYRLTMQPDGNLTLTASADPATVLWGTNTAGHPGSRLVMQYRGNLVLVDPSNLLLWNTGTTGSNAQLALGDAPTVQVGSGSTVLWDSAGGVQKPTPPVGPVTSAIVRAQSWVAAHIPYSQSRYYTNQYGRYRTDCSGYVSMALGLLSSYTTRSLPNVTHVIGKDQLVSGDILNSPNYHVVLFDAWADAGHTRYWAYEQSPGGTAHRVVPYPYWSGHRTSTFIPRRLN